MALAESKSLTKDNISEIIKANSRKIMELPQDKRELYYEILSKERKPDRPLSPNEILEIQKNFFEQNQEQVDSLESRPVKKTKRGRPKTQPKSGVDTISLIKNALPRRSPIKKDPEARRLNTREARQLKTNWVIEKEPIKTPSELPEGWEIESGRINSPDGRRIIMDPKSSRLVIIMTKNAVGENLKPEEMTPVKPAAERNNREFLAEEFPDLTNEQISLIQERLHNDLQEYKRHQRLNNIVFDKERYEPIESKLELPSGWIISEFGEIISDQGPTGYAVEVNAEGLPIKIIRPSGKVIVERKTNQHDTSDSKLDIINSQLNVLITRLEQKTSVQNAEKHQEFYERNFERILNTRILQAEDLAIELAQASLAASRTFARKAERARFEELNGRFEQAKRDVIDDYVEKLSYDLASFQVIINDASSSYEAKALALKNMESIELSTTAAMLSKLTQIDNMLVQSQINLTEQYRFAGLPVGRWSKSFRSFWTEHPKTRLVISSALTGVSVVAATAGFVPVAGTALAAKKVMGVYGSYLGAENVYKAGSQLKRTRVEHKKSEAGKARSEALALDDESYRSRKEQLMRLIPEELTLQQKADLNRFISEHREIGSLDDFELTQSLIYNKIKTDSEKIINQAKVNRHAKIAGLGAAVFVGFASVLSFVNSINRSGVTRSIGGGADTVQPQSPLATAETTTSTSRGLGEVNPPGLGLDLGEVNPPNPQLSVAEFARIYDSWTPEQKVAFGEIVRRPEDFRNMYRILGPNPTPEQIANFKRWVGGGS